MDYMDYYYTAPNPLPWEQHISIWKIAELKTRNVICFSETLVRVSEFTSSMSIDYNAYPLTLENKKLYKNVEFAKETCE